MWQKINFKQSLTGLNSEFSLSTGCSTKVKEPSLSYYLPIAGERIVGFIPYSRLLVLCKMRTASSRIWTLVNVSTSNDRNHYTTSVYITPHIHFTVQHTWNTVFSSFFNSSKKYTKKEVRLRTFCFFLRSCKEKFFLLIHNYINLVIS